MLIPIRGCSTAYPCVIVLRTRVDDRPVQRMCGGPNQAARGVERQLSVRVERDHIPDVSDGGKIAFLDLECVRSTEQQSVEVVELSPLALVPHPDRLALVPSPRAVEQIEGTAAIVRHSGG